jgi:DNA-binding IclR family transcriptional regulator
LNWTASGRLLVGHLPKPHAAHLQSQPPTGRTETDEDVLARAATAALEQG